MRADGLMVERHLQIRVTLEVVEYAFLGYYEVLAVLLVYNYFELAEVVRRVLFSEDGLSSFRGENQH